MEGDKLVRAREIAAAFGIPELWLRKARMTTSNNEGPPFYRIGGRCLYRPSEVAAWIEARRHTPVATSSGRGEVTRG